MTKPDIDKALDFEARNWVEREQARIMHLTIQKERRDRNRAVATLVIGSGVTLLVLAGLLYIAAGGGK